MNNENLVLGTLSNDAFVMVNKKLAQNIGFVEAGLLGEMIALHRYCKQNNHFFKDTWFFVTQPFIEKNLGIKRSTFETATKALVKINVVEKKMMGLPAKNHYSINWAKIVEIMSENEAQPLPLSACGNPATKGAEKPQPSLEESCKQGCGNPATIKKNYKNKDIKINNKNNKEIVNKDNLIDIANSFYTTFSVGRWSKKDWNRIIKNLIEEIEDKQIEYPQAYLKSCLETIAYRHDLNHGKIERKEIDVVGQVPFYNWLEQ